MASIVVGTHTPASLEKDETYQHIADDLISRIQCYDPLHPEERVRQALAFAIVHHGSQKRHSGAPYYQHPLSVATILADMKLDSRTIITALLHDVVEDTDITLSDITENFGEEVSQLVDGVTKLTKIEFQSDNERQAENFRKLIIAISEDIRVLLVKLIDRLHNMQTLQYIKNPEKRARIARETMEIYAPLAERIGMQNVKEELQDIAFKELHPDGYNSVLSRLRYLRESDSGVVDRIAEQIRDIIKNADIKADVYGREKIPYSIWRKMENKNVSFEQLTDIIAFRAVVDTIDDCYRVLGAVHTSFHMVPERFKDFISTPKNNGYQSIHTVVMGPEQQRIEIQIRTEEMHKIAEMGVAAHWTYKQDRPYNIDGRQYQWIRELLHIIEHTEESEEFLKNTRLEMYHDQVFCFTPRGDLIALPRGATPVDFAFAVHSAVGKSCAGAKINGRIMPLRTKLENGDQVEIIQSRSQKPSPAWEHFVVTGKALSEIRKYIRTQKEKEYAALGEAILSKELIKEGKTLNEKMIKTLCKNLHKRSMDEVYTAIGEGTLSHTEVVKALFPEKKEITASFLSRFTRNKANKTRSEESTEEETLSIPITGLMPGMAIHYAACCYPLPGEKIVGIINSGQGVTVHAAACKELEHLVDSPERWIDVTWEEETGEDTFIGGLHATLSHQKGALGELANATAQAGGNINNLRIINRSSDFFEIILNVEVSDVDHLQRIINELEAQPLIHSVKRYQEGKRRPATP